VALIIFDCDGVLVDSEVIAHRLLAQMMGELGRPMTTAACIEQFAGRSLSDTLALAETMLGRPIPDELGQRYGRLLFERLRQDLKPVVGVAAAIAAIPYSRCVASSSSLERIRLSLEVTGLAPLFGKNVFSAEQVGRGKPAPDLYLFAAEKMAVAPGRCIVVEDTSPGVRAGVAAGMTVIGFIGSRYLQGDAQQHLTAAGASRVICSMAELPSAITGAVSRGKLSPHRA
jgi:HAD superfamily hydrolase (TIGR01509 family)